MKVAVIGVGHVGLPTAAVLARFGHEVVASDADLAKIERIKAGDMPFFEEGLGDLVHEGVSDKRLSFETDSSVAEDKDVVFICVGTPPRATGEANLVAVEQAAADIARHASGPTVVVGKSTVPAGTGGRISHTLARVNPAGEFHVASNPEFLREGRAVEDSLRPDRILIGSDSPVAFERLRELYRTLTNAGVPLIETDLRTAELGKHACNAFLALKISYANALARICERAGADVVRVVEVMGADPRIGPAFLSAGLGYGGYCFPKDLQAFERLSSNLGYDFRLLSEVARINDEAVEAMLGKIETALWNLEDKRVALLGLAFKPGTDDTRLSPALALATKLLERGVHLRGYDPAANEAAAKEVPDLVVFEDPYSAAENADCAVVCTEWDEFKTLDLQSLRSVMHFPIILDGRNVLDPKQVADAGFTYIPTGRLPVDAATPSVAPARKP